MEAIARGCSRLRALDLGATDVSEPGLQVNTVQFVCMKYEIKVEMLADIYNAVPLGGLRFVIMIPFILVSCTYSRLITKLTPMKPLIKKLH